MKLFHTETIWPAEWSADVSSMRTNYLLILGYLSVFVKDVYVKIGKGDTSSSEGKRGRCLRESVVWNNGTESTTELGTSSYGWQCILEGCPSSLRCLLPCRSVLFVFTYALLVYFVNKILQRCHKSPVCSYQKKLKQVIVPMRLFTAWGSRFMHMEQCL